MMVERELKKVFKGCLPKEITENMIKFKKEKKYYTTDIAIVSSRILNRDVNSMALKIKKMINSDIISRIEVHDFGILHVYLSDDYLNSTVSNIIKAGKNYGKSSYGKNKKIAIRCFIRNEIDILSSRQMIYSDSLANVLEATGFDVHRECFVYDDIDKNILNNNRVFWDNIVTKNNIINYDIIDEVLVKLQKDYKCYIDGNNIFLKTTLLGDTHDRCLTLEDGSYTDYLCILCYYINVFNDKFDGIIDIWNILDKEFSKSIIIGLSIYGCDLKKYSIKFINEINIDNDIILKWNINTLRYNILGTYYNNIIDTDYQDDLLNIENVYSKMGNIIRNSKVIDDNSIMNNDLTYTITSKLIELEDILIYSGLKGKIHMIVKYIGNIVNLFDIYYNEIYNVDNKYSNREIELIKAIYVVINNSSNVLGIILRENF